MSDDLSALLPESRTLTVGGETLTLTPMRFGQLARALKLVGPLANRLAVDSVDLLALLADEGDKLIALAALLSGKDVAWIEALPTDEAVQLLSALYEVNADFFARRVAPMLSVAIQSAAGTTGQTTAVQPVQTAATPATASGPSSSVS